jgi:hypothetical protein
MHYKSSEIPTRFNFGLFVVFAVNLSISIFASVFLGLILTTLTIGFLLIKSGLEIDTEENRMRRYSRIFGYVSGKWTKIPELDYVTVVSVKMTSKKYQASGAMYVQSPSSDVKYRVNLATKDRRNPVIKVVTCGKSEAINEALKIGEALSLNVLDSTNPDRKWIKTSANTPQ